MKRNRTTGSLGRPTSSCERPKIIALSLCFLGANSWQIVGPASRRIHTTPGVGSNRRDSLLCASRSSPWNVGFACARRSLLWTTPRDGQLAVAADTSADNNGESSGGKSNHDPSSTGNAPNVLLAADGEEGKGYREEIRDYEQQSAEATVEEDQSKRVLVEAAEIMASRGESDVASADRAYRLLNAERDALRESGGGDGDDEMLSSSMTKATAAALLSWIRCKTEGNGLVITEDGRVTTSDTADRRELWATHAPRVLQLLDEVGQEPASDAELQQLYIEAIMYSMSCQGIPEAFVTGKTLAFTSAMGVLVKDFPAQDNGVAHIFQGSYFLAAPWPLRSPRKACKSFDKAVKVNGRSRRNVYYAGVGKLARGDRKGAAEMFRRAMSDEYCESASATERDIAGALREQSKRGLAVNNGVLNCFWIMKILIIMVLCCE